MDLGEFKDIGRMTEGGRQEGKLENAKKSSETYAGQEPNSENDK